MLVQRDNQRAPAGFLPPPAPLPNLRVALARRAEAFGPFDLDDVPDAPSRLGPAQTLGMLARRIVAALDLRRSS